MQQIEMSDYVVSDGETIKIEIEGSPAPETQTRIFVMLDSDPLSAEQMKFAFQVSADRPSHKLLLEFMPFGSNNINLMIRLSGSAGGQFEVPIELSDGITQTRYLRFNVSGRAMTLGVGEG